MKEGKIITEQFELENTKRDFPHAVVIQGAPVGQIKRISSEGMTFVSPSEIDMKANPADKNIVGAISTDLAERIDFTGSINSVKRNSQGSTPQFEYGIKFDDKIGFSPRIIAGLIAATI
jgi:hypothetical protein